MKIAHLQEAMLGWRHDFHLHPELGFKEHRTAENAATLLEEFRIQGLNLETGMEFGFAKAFLKSVQNTPSACSGDFFIFPHSLTGCGGIVRKYAMRASKSDSVIFA